VEKENQTEENLVKKTCRELGITQKELAKYFGVTPKTVSDWATKKYSLPSNFNIVRNLIKIERDYIALTKALKIEANNLTN
jgi:transcriptional regulator with XRE-family HTH domain